MKPNLFLASFAFATLLAAPLPAQNASVTYPPVKGVVEFMMPSSNVACTYIARATAIYTPRGGGPELSCDRREPTYVNIDQGPSGAPVRTDNPGEQSCCGGPNILQYGQTWTGGPFTCTSQQTGLQCAHTNGHGFSLSREKIEVH